MGELSRLEKLREQQKALQSKITAEESKERKQAQAAENRRKLLTGGIALSLTENDDIFKTSLHKQLEQQIEERDRYLFPEIWPDAVRMRGRPKKDDDGETAVSEPEPEKVEVD